MTVGDTWSSHCRATSRAITIAGKDTVWWNHSAEGIVDLPVKLTRIIIEFRYLFVTYLDAQRKEPKPSPVRRILLKDDFPMK